MIECDCEGGGGSETLTHQLNPGHYYAVVSVRDASAGAYTLERESRTITSTSLSFSTSKTSAGTGLGIDVKVSPAASGPVVVDIERFDPVFGWQFYAQEHGFVAQAPPACPRPQPSGAGAPRPTTKARARPAPAPSASRSARLLSAST